MGDRRMLSKSILQSARFLKMSKDAKIAYVFLVLNADDDGVAEAYPVLKLCELPEEVLYELAERRFIFILNEDLVVFIEDWRVQNKLRADRKTDSKYKQLVEQLRPDVELLSAKIRSDIKRGCKQGQTVDGPRTAQDNITKLNITEDKIINQSFSLNGKKVAIDYKQTVADNIHLHELLSTANMYGPEEVQMVEEIYNTICDVVNYPRNHIVIDGAEIPWEHVRERFLGLGYTHIANVLHKLVDKNLKIKNMYGYLISTLYLESMSGVLAEQSKLHDERLKELRGEPYAI